MNVKKYKFFFRFEIRDGLLYKNNKILKRLQHIQINNMIMAVNAKFGCINSGYNFLLHKLKKNKINTLEFMIYSEIKFRYMLSHDDAYNTIKFKNYLNRYFYHTNIIIHQRNAVSTFKSDFWNNHRIYSECTCMIIIINKINSQTNRFLKIENRVSKYKKWKPWYIKQQNGKWLSYIDEKEDEKYAEKDEKDYELSQNYFFHNKKNEIDEIVEINDKPTTKLFSLFKRIFYL